MNILLHLPAGTLDKCFRPTDLDRLRAQHAAWGGRTDDLAQLLQEFAARALDLGAVGAGWGTPPLTPDMLSRAPRLNVIVHSAGSVRALLPEVVWQRGIRVASCNEALGIGVAETTLGMIICGLKGFFPARAHTAAGQWHDPKLGTDHVVTRELFDVTIGVIAASKTGAHLMRLLRQFEVRVLVTDPFLPADRAREMGATLVTLDELVRQSDVVTLHAPSLPATRHMLGPAQFRAMKDGAIFINTARGAIVDEDALVAELRTGRISAFLDVTDPEPPAADHPFRSLPNVVLTPHLAGAVSNGCLRQGRSAVDQLLEFGRGERMHGEITTEAFRRMA
jgi:phosphoglycerate dehydrogenase-like enzyme